jgi:prevent-host-death family protein
VAEFQADAQSLIRRIRRTKRALVLTEQGRNAAVVVDPGEYERMLEELHLLRDIHAAEQQLANGKGVSHDQARQEILRRPPARGSFNCSSRPSLFVGRVEG